jgi:NADPH:quinone reductase-like Zn-dependent oxidoreductase
MPSNQAVYLDAVNASFKVGDAEYPKPAAGEVVVRNRAVAMNPVDWKIRVSSTNIQGHQLLGTLSNIL